MNEKEIAEIRRRFRYEKTNINRVCGCMVNDAGEIAAEFDQSLGLISEDDADRILTVLKKTLSGTLGRNIIEVEFSTKQVMESEEHKLLSEIRSSELTNSELLRKLYEKIISNVEIDGSYMILLASDKYDVFDTTADGNVSEESSRSFSYFVCAVCPIRSGKSALSYYFPGKCFRSVCPDGIVANPESGFMFPAFDDRSANIYKAMYYTKDPSDSHTALAEALFASEIPMPAVEQKETLGSIMKETIDDECSLSVVRSFHGQIREMIETHKAEKIDEPLVMTKDDISEMLRFSGVPDSKVTAFEEKYDETFGKDTEIYPKNIADAKTMQIKTPEISIKVDEGFGGLVETRMIDGTKYILIRADGEVLVNGVNINI